MIELAISVCWVMLFALITLLLFLVWLKSKQSIYLMKEEVPKLDTWNGKEIYLRDDQDWESVPRGIKRKMIREFEKKVENGSLIKVTNNDGFTGYVTKEEYRRVNNSN